MNRMVCEDCGTVFFSAAARTMVQRGERCGKCDGRLLLDEGPRPVPVNHGDANGDEDDS